MLYLAILLSAVLVYLIQTRLYEKHTNDRVSWTVRTSAEEVFEDEDIYFYEEIVNDKFLPLPYVKINSDLPEGLFFHFTEITDGVLKESFEPSAQSVYVVRSYQKIRRRWRVTCRRRGIYAIGESVFLTNDLFGVNGHSMSSAQIPGFHACRLVVLPKPIDLHTEFLSSDALCGDDAASRSLLTDPLLRAGCREYRPGDPLRMINWKSTASHNQLMVNVEEHFQRSLFNIILNMQSRDIEKNPEVPSAPYEIERCISVAATLFDRASEEQIPVRMMLNTPPKSLLQPTVKTAGSTDPTGTMKKDLSERSDPVIAERDVEPIDSGDQIGCQIAATRTYEGRTDTLEALRMLASVQMKISVPEEKLLDHILEHPQLYTAAGEMGSTAGLVFISSYFSERMIGFHRALEQRGIPIVYYITSANRNAMKIPEDIRIFFAVGSLADR